MSARAKSRRTGVHRDASLWPPTDEHGRVEGACLLTSSPRLKPGDSNLLTPLGCGVGAVIPHGFLLVPASATSPSPRVGVGLGRR
jgi:hypothetical protein